MSDLLNVPNLGAALVAVSIVWALIRILDAIGDLILGAIHARHCRAAAGPDEVVTAVEAAASDAATHAGETLEAIGEVRDAVDRLVELATDEHSR